MHNLAKLLTENVNGATFIGLDTETVPTLRGGKSNQYQGRVSKVMTGSNVMVFQNKTTNAYNNMVKRRLEAEGKSPESFVLGERQWGHRVPNTCFVEHKGEYYVEVIFLKAGDVYYTVDGVKVDKAVIEGLPTEKVEGEQGGLNNKVIIRTFHTDSIRSITINKETYSNLYFNIGEIE